MTHTARWPGRYGSIEHQLGVTVPGQPTSPSLPDLTQVPAFNRLARATPDHTLFEIAERAARLQHGKFAIGVEILPDRIIAALTDHSGERIAKRARYVVSMDPLPLAEAIGDLARGLARTELGIDLPHGNVVIGLQIGAPIDTEAGVVLHYGNLRDEPRADSRMLVWEGPVPLADYVREETGCRTVIENDAASYAVYEQKHGGHDGSFAVVLVRDGVGAAVVIDDRVLPIPLEIGHLNVPGGDRACLCGKRGCLEAVAGRRAIPAIVASRLGTEVPAEFVALARDSQPLPEVVKVFQEAGEAVAQGIAALLTVFGVEVVVVFHDQALAESAPASPATAAFHTAIKRFKEHTFPPLRDCQAETRSIRPTAGAHGAALVALNRLTFVPLS